MIILMVNFCLSSNSFLHYLHRPLLPRQRFKLPTCEFQLTHKFFLQGFGARHETISPASANSLLCSLFTCFLLCMRNGSWYFNIPSEKFPIAVEVYNVFAKGYGVLPLSITSEFGSQLGRKPTISADDGQIYRVRFEKTSDGGLLTTGWCLFVQQINLITKSKVILHYVGESYFLIKSSDHEGKSNDCDEEMDNSSVFLETPPLMQEIIINPYSAKNLQQHLPTGFVQFCLNVNLNLITLIVKDGRKWECGLYRSKGKPSKVTITAWMEHLLL